MPRGHVVPQKKVHSFTDGGVTTTAHLRGRQLYLAGSKGALRAGATRGATRQAATPPVREWLDKNKRLGTGVGLSVGVGGWHFILTSRARCGAVDFRVLF